MPKKKTTKKWATVRSKSTPTRVVHGGTMHYGPLQWALLSYYAKAMDVNISQAGRAIVSFFAQSDKNFNPEQFWKLGVMPMYDEFVDRYWDEHPELVVQLIKSSTDFAEKFFKWTPPKKLVPRMPKVEEEVFRDG